MIHVFIGYGGPEAEEVAKRLSSFLKNEGLVTFLACPESHDLVSTDDFKLIIEKNLLDCNIAIFVCHKGTSRRKEVKREIGFLFDRNMEHKIISFAESDTCIPIKIRERWHPLHFASEKPEESFCRLLNEVFRCHIRLDRSVPLVNEEERIPYIA